MKEQRNQKKLSIYVTLLIVVICLFGISFALFKFNASQATQNDITTLNCFEIEYSDVTDAITIANDFPISDADGLERTPYTFKIKNKCSQYLNVQIGVETLTTSQIQPNLIKGVITNKGETPTSAKILSNGILGTPVNGGTNYILLESSLAAFETKEFDLRLWFTESMTKEQGSGKTYQGKVTVISSPKTDKTVYGKLLADYSSNRGVQKTTDENGKDVYYYAGNVTNNNILFNNYCWKMVRTTETDGVKLIYNGVYSEETKCNNTGTDIYLETNGTKYNTSYKSPAYVGYMYGTVYENAWKRATDLGTYYYGSAVTWNGTTYTLTDAESGAIADMYSKLSNKHYTCLSTSSSCTTVYYIYYMSSATSPAYYMTLTNGKKIEDALDEMLNYNTTNSDIKTVIDNWYSTNMTNSTEYIENAMYCNNRNISTLGGFNPSGGRLTARLLFNDNNTRNLRLICQDKEDQFTLKVDSGGTLGYGNNALDYPVGLLTSKEASLAFGGSDTNYLNNGDEYWLLSPYFFNYDDAGVRRVGNGSLTGGDVFRASGARPAISLKQNVIITGGTGEIEDPYTVALPS